MRSCKNCKYARKAANSEYVGCSAAVRQNITDYFHFYEKQEISTGWVNLNAYPNGGEGFGLITNGIPCFKPDDSCKHFEKRSN
jgi:hypothetical protein